MSMPWLGVAVKAIIVFYIVLQPTYSLAEDDSDEYSYTKETPGSPRYVDSRWKSIESQIAETEELADGVGSGKKSEGDKEPDPE